MEVVINSESKNLDHNTYNNPHIYARVKDEAILNNLSNSQKQALSIRNNLIEWLYRIHLRLGGYIDTFFKCINYLDKYIINAKEIQKTASLQLASGVCLFIAYKFEEVSYFDLAFLEDKIFRSKFTKVEIIHKEIEILKTLKFNLDVSTVQTFSNELLFKHNVYEIFEKTNNFVNLFALIIDEFLNLKPNVIAKITFKTTILLLLKNNSINRDNYKFYINIINDTDFSELSFNLFNLITEQFDQYENIFG